MKLRTVFLISGLFFSSHCFALFCPNGFNQIDYGDTVAHVIEQCGQPTATNVHKGTENVPQEWTYYLRVNPTDQSTMKVSFAFVDNKLTNMTTNGFGMNAFGLCKGFGIQIGSSMQDVQKACGTPAMITKTNLTPDAAQGTPAPEITELTWNNVNPPVILIFENGKLKTRK